jgi:hypothetical protein
MPTDENYMDMRKFTLDCRLYGTAVRPCLAAIDQLDQIMSEKVQNVLQVTWQTLLMKLGNFAESRSCIPKF